MVDAVFLGNAQNRHPRRDVSWRVPGFGVQQIIDLAAQEGFAPVDEQPPTERPHVAQAECRFVHIAVEVNGDGVDFGVRFVPESFIALERAFPVQHAPAVRQQMLHLPRQGAPMICPCTRRQPRRKSGRTVKSVSSVWATVRLISPVMPFQLLCVSGLVKCPPRVGYSVLSTRMTRVCSPACTGGRK